MTLFYGGGYQPVLNEHGNDDRQIPAGGSGESGRSGLHAATQYVAEAFFEADMPSEARMFQRARDRRDEREMHLLAARLVDRLIKRQ